MEPSTPHNLRLSVTALRISRRIGRHLGNLPLRTTLEIVLREVDRLQEAGEFPTNSILNSPQVPERAGIL